MSQVSYGHTTEAGFLSILDAIKQGEWGAIRVPDNPLPQELLMLGVTQLSKVELMWALLRMRRILNPKPEDAAEIFDQDWDRVQRLYNADITALENDKDPQTRADGAFLRSVSLKGQGTAQTKLRYEAEVQWGFSQVEKADEEAVRILIDRHNLQARIDEIEAITRALAEAIGWDLATHKRLSPSVQKRVALRRCADALAMVHQQLETLLEILPSTSPEAAHLNALLAPLLKLQAERPQPPTSP